MSEQPRVYDRAGVSISAGDALSAIAAQLIEATWENSPYLRIERVGSGAHFRGPRVINVAPPLVHCKRTGGMDGDGTKPILHAASGMMRAAGFDLVAMLAGDHTRNGGLPGEMWDQMDVRTLANGDPTVMQAYEQALRGICDAASIARVPVVGGEVAEVGVCVGSEDPLCPVQFMLCGAMNGYLDLDRLITGERMRPGMAVMALREFGAGCNWISAVRSGLREHFGQEWYNHPDAEELIKQAATPCTIYDYLLARLNGWFCYDDGFHPLIWAAGIAHLTGGGPKGKFGDDLLFRYDLSAELTDLWPAPAIIEHTVEWTNCPDDQLYAGNGAGQRVLVVTDVADVTRFIAEAAADGIEAKQCGVITQSAVPTLQITSALSGDLVEYVKESTN